MNITNYDMDIVHKRTKVEFEKVYDTFETQINNFDLEFHLRLLKDASYLYVYLEFDGFYLIETKQFFANEAKEGIIEDLIKIVNKYKNSRFQLYAEKKFFRTRLGVKIFEDDEWKVLAKPQKRIKYES